MSLKPVVWGSAVCHCRWWRMTDDETPINSVGTLGKQPVWFESSLVGQ